MNVPERRKEPESFFPGRGATGRSLRRQQALGITLSLGERKPNNKITCIPPKGLSFPRTCRAMYSCDTKIRGCRYHTLGPILTSLSNNTESIIDTSGELATRETIRSSTPTLVDEEDLGAHPSFSTIISSEDLLYIIG